VLRGLKRRLDRLWLAYQQRVAVHQAQCDQERGREDFATALRFGLTRAGVDPATVPALRRFEPGGWYTPRPKPPPRPPQDDPIEQLRQLLLRIVERCREAPLDLGKATPIELFAVYCFVPDMPGVAYLTDKPAAVTG
jgi:hypothetical protein